MALYHGIIEPLGSLKKQQFTEFQSEDSQNGELLRRKLTGVDLG